MAECQSGSFGGIFSPQISSTRHDRGDCKKYNEGDNTKLGDEDILDGSCKCSITKYVEY